MSLQHAPANLDPDRSERLVVIGAAGLVYVGNNIETAWDRARLHQPARVYRGRTLLSGPSEACAAAAQPRSESVERALRNQHQHRVARRYRARTDAE